MCLLPSDLESILKAQPYWGVNTKHPQPLVCTGALPHLFKLAGGRIVSFPQDGRDYSEKWDLHSEYRARLQPGPNLEEMASSVNANKPTRAKPGAALQTPLSLINSLTESSNISTAPPHPNGWRWSFQS